MKIGSENRSDGAWICHVEQIELLYHQTLDLIFGYGEQIQPRVEQLELLLDPPIRPMDVAEPPGV